MYNYKRMLMNWHLIMLYNTIFIQVFPKYPNDFYLNKFPEGVSMDERI